MPILAKSEPESNREPHPSGIYPAVCAFVEDIGMQTNKFDPTKPPQHKVIIVWETAELMPDQRPFQISKRYTLSLHEKATLRHDLESWRGKPFTVEELEGFDIEKLMNAQCLLNIIHKPKKAGGFKAEIQSVIKPQPNSPKLLVYSEKPPAWIQKERDNQTLPF